MKKALVLLIGIGVYVWFLQLGQDLAQRELNRVQDLYTSAQTQALAISGSNR